MSKVAQQGSLIYSPPDPIEAIVDAIATRESRNVVELRRR